jgi:hypothetical protein
MEEPTMPPSDPYGAKDASTEYEVSGRPKANKRRAKSVAGVIITLLILVTVAAAVLLTKGTTDPAPVGSSGAGVVREPAPANGKTE